MNQKEVKNLLRRYRIYPSKRLGQNFLVNESVLKKIIETANLKKEDVVLEVGPGIGNLTLELAKKVKRVIAIEKDPKMCQILEEVLRDFPNVEVIQADILKVKFQNPNPKYQINSEIQIPKNYKVVANLPYYITSPVLRHFLEIVEVKPLQMVLMVQKEVAQRICAKPPKMTILAVSVQFYAKPEIISYISKKFFWPSPKVDSAILRITQIHTDKKTDTHRFFKVVRAGFSQPRKQLVNNLSKGLKIKKEKIKNWLLENGIKPEQRAETLKIEDWLNLTKSLK